MESSATTSPVNSVWSSSLITFAAGASYGFVTVLVGQPLDTIKTRLQGIPESAHSNSFTVGRALFRREGVRGLYRGGLPLLLSGSLMRSALFGVSSHTKTFLDGCSMGLLPENKLLFGTIDYTVILAGMAGGVGRALVEIPADFLKSVVKTKTDMR